MFLEPGWGWTGAPADSRRLCRIQLQSLQVCVGREVLLRSRKPSAPVSYGLSRQDDVPELGFAPSPGLEAP